MPAPPAAAAASERASEHRGQRAARTVRARQLQLVEVQPQHALEAVARLGLRHQRLLRLRERVLQPLRLRLKKMRLVPGSWGHTMRGAVSNKER